MGLIRKVLGFIILLLDRLTSPTPVVRDAVTQKMLDEKTARFTLYHLEACPFCVKVRRQIRRLNLKITMKEIARDPAAGVELIAGGKLDQAPCLRIDSAAGTQWMYESTVINLFLEEAVSPRKMASQ